MTNTQLPVSHAPTSNGGHLVAVDGRTLPLRSMRLCARAAGGIANVKVVQTFSNPFAEVLQLRYLLPLPADGAIAGFAFTIGERRIAGAIERRADARERFERALVEGRTAGLLEQDRDSLFTQELGNVPPGAEIVAEVDVDQPLAWVDAQWEWRFPTTVAPRYLGAPGRVPDGGRIDVPIADASIGKRLQVELHVADALVPGSAILSPSHPLRGEAAHGGAAVGIADAAIDRDVVVRWRVAAPAVGVGLRIARPPASAPHAHEAHGLLTLVPPAGSAAKLPRDLIVLLDISGSMHGQPLAAAKQVTGELIRSLDAGDRLELIAFASRPQPWLGAPCLATAGNQAAALQWLSSLQAGGGTEMRDAIAAALLPLRDGAQRQVVLVTDGQIGFEAEIVREIRAKLPASSRVHVVGVGSAPNRSLTKCAARAGRGVEVLIGLTEDPAPAARRLLARTAAPVVTNLTIAGSALLGTCPIALPDLFANAPARVGLRLWPLGGTLAVDGVSAAGPFHHELVVPPAAAGDGEAFLSRLVGREWVEDLEAAIAATGDLAGHAESIERIGLQFGLATRATSWIAIDTQVGVDPRDARRIVDVPHELAHGMSMEALGLRPAQGMTLSQVCTAMVADMPMAAEEAPRARTLHEPAGEMARALWSGRRRRLRRGAPVPIATLRLRDANGWVFDVTGLTEWTVPLRVVLVFADGREFTADLVVERSTRAGRHAPEAVVRIVLRGDARLPDEKPAQLRLGEPRDATVVLVA